jgi:hypothetical protein
MTIKKEFSRFSFKKERRKKETQRIGLINLFWWTEDWKGWVKRCQKWRSLFTSWTNLPQEYEYVVEQVEGDLENGLTVDSDKLRNKLSAKFGRIKKNSFKNQSRITEGALFAGWEGFEGNCWEFCRRKKKDQAEGGHMEVFMAQTESEEISIIKEEEKGLISVEKETLRQIWVGDSGASWHMTNAEEGLHNWRPIKQGMKMGNSSVLEATKFGSITTSFEDPEKGRKILFELKELKYIPELWRNLFSVKAALKERVTYHRVWIKK